MGVTWCLRKGDGIRVGDLDFVVDDVGISPKNNRKYAVVTVGDAQITLDDYGIEYSFGEHGKVKISNNQQESSPNRIRLYFDAPRHTPMKKIKRKGNV